MNEEKTDLWAAQVIAKFTEGFSKPKQQYRTSIVAYPNSWGQPKLNWISKHKSMF